MYKNTRNRKYKYTAHLPKPCLYARGVIVKEETGRNESTHRMRVSVRVKVRDRQIHNE